MTQAEHRIELIRQRLQQALDPKFLEVEDESHLHVGHPGAQSGLGHFRVRIASEKFVGILPLKRHQMVYDALGDLMKTDIHAVSIHADTPEN